MRPGVGPNPGTSAQPICCQRRHRPRCSSGCWRRRTRRDLRRRLPVAIGAASDRSGGGSRTLGMYCRCPRSSESTCLYAPMPQVEPPLTAHTGVDRLGQGPSASGGSQGALVVYPVAREPHWDRTTASARRPRPRPRTGLLRQSDNGKETFRQPTNTMAHSRDIPRAWKMARCDCDDPQSAQSAAPPGSISACVSLVVSSDRNATRRSPASIRAARIWTFGESDRLLNNGG